MQRFLPVALIALAPFLVWAAQFLFVYVFAAIACARGGGATAPLATGIATLAALAALGGLLPLAWRLPPFEQRLSLLSALLAAIAIVWTGLPAALVPPCQ